MTTEAEVAVEPDRVTALSPVSDSLAVEQQREAGLNALARMSEAEFFERMRSLRLGLDRFDMMMSEVLETGTDLMRIEGVEKPILTLSGAEKICFVARLVPTFHAERTLGSPPESPAIHYVVRCDLHLGNTDGPAVAQGVGSCSSHERKYRWRYAEKHCPECGVVGALFKSKHTAKPSSPFAGTKPFFCWQRKGGCGKEFAETDPRITQQTLGMVENSEPHDLDNTLLKMAKKRAFVDASKTATASSGRVTQDLEEDAAGSEDAKEMRDAIMTRAREVGMTKRGDIYVVVKAALGRTIKSQDEFTRLKASELRRVLDAMPPVPVADAKPDGDMTLDEKIEDRESAHE
jgi:hypothetical protein